MSVIWLVPALPFAGFIVLLFSRQLGLTGRRAGVVGSLAVGLSFLSALAVFAAYSVSPPAGGSFTLLLWQWFSSGGLESSIGLTVDALSLVMVLVVTGVGFLIHLFSIEHMAGEEGYPRFFAYMNLFVGSMLMLVLADNLVLLYLGWEGVGLCSYLLIGFWYRDPANGRAARKAFIVTRVGDISLLIGIFLVVLNLGSFNIQESAQRALGAWPVGSPTAIWAAALILGGALGKSAQLPLQTWLPDAMAGPSPVSALIHAATMVTAGVYLVARTHVIFTLAPPVLFAVAVIGAATLFVAGASAVAQTDIKRVLAYSTMSQIGYMFLALGVGAWTGAIFHLVTHAFFKSLLFLAAGVIINALHHEHDIRAMGGLARRMPFTFWVFLIGAFGLTALPPVTAGFASKDAIVAKVWESGDPRHVLWAVAMLGVFLTSVYTFRLLFLVFGGRGSSAREHAGHGEDSGLRAGPVMGVPLGILAILCLVGGFLDFPRLLGGVPFITRFLASALPTTATAESGGMSEALLALLPLLVTLVGIPLGALLARGSARRYAAAMEGAAVGEAAVMAAGSGVAAASGLPEPNGFVSFFKRGWAFDTLYEFLIQRPFEWLARINRRDFVNVLSEGLGALNMFASLILRKSQTGRVRLYIGALALGAALIVAAAVLL
ncbi:MAG TPA: NADH-quinone oxidoreductase subunit L [Rectinemataceae bacterium]|nr:NADH-quinone oxidoreductase subunit L [Rectinemataceae bacterium]